jgi:hypothetical protein
MIEKIIAALSFRKDIYKEVEEDASFTTLAWIIVAIAALLSSMGTNAAMLQKNFGSWLFGSMFRAAFVVAGFALSCFIIDWVSKRLFNANTNFKELVRTLGLASIWSAVGFLAIISVISPALRCATGIFQFAGSVVGLIAWVSAAKEALDLEWGETILTIVIGWVAQGIIQWLAGLILVGLGLGVSASIFSLIS